MIKFKNISHAYDSKSVVYDLDLDIFSNQLTCFLGSSGCGKSTILRLIAGLEIPASGQIEINNVVATENGVLRIPPAQRSIGFVFQDLALWPHFTVYENIAFGLQQKKRPNVKHTVSEMLDFFDLRKHQKKNPHQLSGGQKQMVAIARSLVLHPKILLMDEPLSDLDVKLKRKLLDYINRLKQDFELTIVYVTHDHREAFTIADQVVVLQEGRVAAYGTVEEIKKSDNEYVQYFLEY